MGINKDYVEHVGIPHDGPIPHSGRYEYGSGKNPYQDEDDIYKPLDTIQKRIKQLEEKGITNEKDICEELSKQYGYKISTGDLRQLRAVDKTRENAYNISYAVRLMNKGYSVESIAEKMGKDTKTVNNYLDPIKQERYMNLRRRADYLKKIVDESGKPIDVGEGVNNLLGCSKEELEKSVRILRQEGYNYLRYKIPQLSTGNETQGVFLYKPDGNLTKAELRAEFNNHLKNNDYIIPTCNIKENSDGIKIYEKINDPKSLDPKRLIINYATEDGQGGALKDGVIEMRRGVGDLDMNGKNYAQVRILVGKDRYLKGMAVYTDDLPEGIDVRFNTNKKEGTSIKDVLKEVKPRDYDSGIPTDILGSYIKRQNFYIDKDGKEKQGVLNIVNEQGESWSTYDDTLASQFLSKQKESLAEKQLKITIDDKKRLLKEYESLTNPIVRQHYLKEFSEECEKDADYLKAAALPRQSWNVILPVTSLKDDEIYAPQFNNGEKIALIRYPHGGIFEIPVLTVNNKNKEGAKVIGNDAVDAVGINSKVAQKLSGADFDGDSVLAIPNNDGKIISKSTLAELKGFDPKEAYPYQEGQKILKGDQKQREMGIVSNLITDMTIQGASDSEIARAVRHSMVVIDAEKHKLNWQQSYKDNNISQLKKKWQVQLDENGNIKPNTHGAATLISRAKSEATVPEKSSYYKIDEKGNKYSYIYKKDKNGNYITDSTGKKIIETDKEGKPLRDYERLSNRTYNETKKETVGIYSEKNWPPKGINLNDKYKNGNKIYTVKKDIDKNGNKVYTVTRKVFIYNDDGSIKQKNATEKTTKMRATNDARTLISSSNTKMENIYANYANELKNLSKEALKKSEQSSKYEYSQSAAKVYNEEVKSIKKKLEIAGTFKPLERKAQALANKIYRQMDEQSDEGIDKSNEKKAQNQAVAIARATITSSSKDPVALKASKRIKLTDREWEAIQSGAVTKQTVINVLNNTDKDDLRKRAMPKQKVGMTNAEINRARRLLDQGYTMSEVAQHLGYSVTKIKNNLYSKEGG